MGGVDLSDMLTSLYLIDIQSRKRWFLKIFTHLLNICNVNDWLLYRRHSDQLDIPKAKQLTLLQFTKAVAYALLLARKNPNWTPGRPYKKWSLSSVEGEGKKPILPKSIVNVRFNEMHHWPEFGDKRNRCRVCSMLSSTYCSKCKVNLCIQKEWNCFHDFHH